MLYLASIYNVFPFKQLISLNEDILKFWHNTVGFSWGAAIIGLTVVIRLAILPLTFKQVRSMQALQRLQPEMKKLQQRYKDDKQRLNEELMKFYREHGVNPLGSCLPLILQLPFFFSLFGVLRSTEFKHEVCPPAGHCPPGGGGAHFLFIPNILEPLTHDIPALIALIVLYVATQLASSIVTSVNIQDPTQRKLMYALPFVFVPIIWRFQAGLLVYWITTNIWTVGQQLFIRRFMPTPAPVPATARAAANTGKGSAALKADGKGAQPSKARDGRGATATADKSGNGAKPQKAPPPSPRKRKKRSGRRR